jgi:hypothetical protein
LRVPDALLDVVKEEQTRAREAGKSSRGGTHTGGAGRGASCPHILCPFCSLIGNLLLQVAVERHNEVWLSLCLVFLFWGTTLRHSVAFFQVAVVHAVDQRAGAGHAGAACDIANMPECVCPVLAYVFFSYFRNRRSNGTSDGNWEEWVMSQSSAS